jgi:hypothetical protein
MVTYRGSGPWGGGKGAPLVASEVDGNFYEHDTRLNSVEGAIPNIVSIANFTVSGNQFYVHMTDGTIQGPFVLPEMAWNFRGPWQPFTSYNVNDVVTATDGGVYMVLHAHTSAAAFNAAANDGAGHAYYGLLLTTTAVIPPGGAALFVLSKMNDLDYQVMWRRVLEMPTGGTTGQLARKVSNAVGDAVWYSVGIGDLTGVALTAPASADVLTFDGTNWVNRQPGAAKVIKSAPYTPALADVGAFIVLTNSTNPLTIRIPADVTLSFPIGAELNFHQDGTGVITIAGDAGVTLLYPPQFSNTLFGQYATATVKKTGANEWRLFGLLTQL